jgi:hypothetical protein
MLGTQSWMNLFAEFMQCGPQLFSIGPPETIPIFIELFFGALY